MIVGLGVGGAENVVIQLANSFVEDNDITLVLLSNDLALKNKLHEKVKIIVYDLKNNKSNFLKLLLFLISTDFDIIHAHMYHSNLISRIVKIFKPSIKIINSIHNTIEIKNKNKCKVVNFLYRITDFAVNNITNVSVQASENTIKNSITNRRKITTIYNGSDFVNFPLSAVPVVLNDKCEFKILTVASLTEQKGIDNAILAVSDLIRHGYNISYHILGNGSLRPKLLHMIAQLEMEEYIHLHGVSNNVAGYMNYVDLFLLPSRWEGFGLVLLEAVACDLNIIATDCDGPVEILGKNYVNLCASDDIQDLSNKIKACYSDNNIYYDKKQIINSFSVLSMIEGYKQLYVK